MLDEEFIHEVVNTLVEKKQKQRGEVNTWGSMVIREGGKICEEYNQIKINHYFQDINYTSSCSNCGEWSKIF